MSPRTQDTIGAEIDALLQEKLDVDSSLSSIKNQIAEAKAKAWETNEYASREWFRRANDALKHKKRRSQEIQIEIGKLKREQKAMKVTSEEQAFVDAARELLPKDVYMEIWLLAREKKS